MAWSLVITVTIPVGLYAFGLHMTATCLVESGTVPQVFPSYESLGRNVAERMIWMRFFHCSELVVLSFVMYTDKGTTRPRFHPLTFPLPSCVFYPVLSFLLLSPCTSLPLVSVSDEARHRSKSPISSSLLCCGCNMCCSSFSPIGCRDTHKTQQCWGALASPINRFTATVCWHFRDE